MSDLQSQFETAAQEVQSLAKKPDDQSMLKLYALYKPHMVTSHKED